MELELAFAERSPEMCEELAGEHASEHLDGKEEGPTDIAQGIFHDTAVPALAEQKPKRRAIRRSPDQFVGCGQVEVQLAGVLRLELTRLQLDDEVSVQPDVVREQIDVEGLVRDHRRHLAADEGEAPAKLEQEIAEIDQQAAFELPLLEIVRQGEEVTVVQVAQDLFGHSRAHGRKRPAELLIALPSRS